MQKTTLSTSGTIKKSTKKIYNKSKSIELDKFKAGDGALMAALGGAGSGALTGAGIGMAVGMPWLGAGIGAAIGGINGIISNNAQEEAERKRKEEEDRLYKKSLIQSDNAAFSQYANGGRGYNIEFDKGGLIQLSSDGAKIVGDSHENGGVPLTSGVEVEGGETIVQESDSTKVFSDDLGYAKLAEMLLKQKGILEQKLALDVIKLGNSIEKISKSKDIYEYNGNIRKEQAYKFRTNLIQSQIANIDKTIDELFNSQQQVNGNQVVSPSGQPIEQSEEGQAMMSKGGKILANNGINVSNNIWNFSKNIGKKGYNLAKDAINNDPTLSMGLLQSAGNFLSNTANIKRLENTDVPKPKLSKAYTSNPNIDVSGQLSAIDEAYNRIQHHVSQNVANPAIANAILADSAIRASIQKSGVIGNKINAESMIRRENLANIQNIDNINLEKQRQYIEDKYNKEMAILQAKSERNAALMGDIKDSLTEGRKENYQDRQLMMEASKSNDIYLLDINPFIDNDTFDMQSYIKMLKDNGLDEDAIKERVNRAISILQAGNKKIKNLSNLQDTK